MLGDERLTKIQELVDERLNEDSTPSKVRSSTSFCPFLTLSSSLLPTPPEGRYRRRQRPRLRRKG